MDKTKENNNSKSDYYSPVMICQIILCILLLLTVFFMKNDGVRSDFQKLMSKSMTTEDFTSLVYTVKEFFQSESAILSVFSQHGEEATSSSETTEASTFPDGSEVTDFPQGGEDVPVSEVPSYCTFSPLKLTVPLLRPIENGRYTSPFGFRINPITGEYGFHTGLDIAAPEGTVIRAALNGTVTKVSEDSRAGKYIFLTHHNGLVTFYCHCSEIVAEEGAKIRQGETIALVGSTGWSTGNHLHFEVRKNNIRYDPLPLLENDS